MLDQAATPHTDAGAIPPDIAKPELATIVAPWILAVTVTFNFGLCSVHTNLRAISALEIIAVEVLLVAAAAALGFLRRDSLRRPWLTVLLLQLVWLLFLWIARDEVLPKPIRDAIIMPVFVVLGMSASRVDMARLLLRANLAILAIAIFEALFLNTFLSACNIIDYFISKGSTPEFQRFFNDTNLFVSGIRPGGRFLFEFSGIHRISSVFLEPVSLGMYGAISGMAFLAFSQRLSRAQLWLGLASSFALIVLADGRLALGVLILCVLIRPLAGRLDVRLAALTFPVLFFLGLSIIALGLGFDAGEGTVHRLYKTYGVLSSVDLWAFIGFGGLAIPSTVDTGLGYLLETQGILGVLLFWLVPIFVHRRLHGPARIFVFFLTIYLSFGFLFSAAIFTIKTAALLWFLYGYAVASEFRSQSDTSLPLPENSHMPNPDTQSYAA